MATPEIGVPELDGSPLFLLDLLPETGELLVDGDEGRHAVEVEVLLTGIVWSICTVSSTQWVGRPVPDSSARCVKVKMPLLIPGLLDSDQLLATGRAELPA